MECVEDKSASRFKYIYEAYPCNCHQGMLLFPQTLNLSYNHKEEHIDLSFPCILHFRMELATLMTTAKILHRNTESLQLKTCLRDNLACILHIVRWSIYMEVDLGNPFEFSSLYIHSD